MNTVFCSGFGKAPGQNEVIASCDLCTAEAQSSCKQFWLHSFLMAGFRTGIEVKQFRALSLETFLMNYIVCNSVSYMGAPVMVTYISECLFQLFRVWVMDGKWVSSAHCRLAWWSGTCS